jgi:hypothetical protein
MRQRASHWGNARTSSPRIGDRIERGPVGAVRCGTVQYADEIQLLVVWDDGSIGSLRIGHDDFRIIQRAPAVRRLAPRQRG